MKDTRDKIKSVGSVIEDLGRTIDDLLEVLWELSAWIAYGGHYSSAGCHCLVILKSNGSCGRRCMTVKFRRRLRRRHRRRSSSSSSSSSSINQSINQSIILFADTNVSQWAHAIQRYIDYVINNPTLNTEIA